MKTNSVIETRVDGATLFLTFANGEELRLNPNELSADIATAACLHGLKQKLCDAAAMSRNPETGKPATVEEKYAAVRAVYDRLLRGEWNAAKGEGAGSGGLLFRALCRLSPHKPADEIRAWLAGKSDTEKKALRENARVRAVIDEIRPKTDSGVDSDALLADL